MSATEKGTLSWFSKRVICLRELKKIYRAVFVEQRMPKGSRIKLTKKEYLSLEEWLLTEEIF